MEKVFEFISPKAEYTADATVITCIDKRFYSARKAFIKALKLKNPDVVEIAGAIKDITHGSEEEAAFVLKQIRISTKLHHSRRVILLPHRDCGAYGGSEELGDQATEYKVQADEIAKATLIIQKAFPEVSVESYFLDFDGAHRA